MHPEEAVRRLAKKLPSFPDGRIDYSGARVAAVVTVFVHFNGEILLVKRSQNVESYRGMWNAIAGFYDEPVAPEAKAVEEVTEELGVKPEALKRVRVGETYRLRDRKLGRTWIVTPMAAELGRRPRISLDFEATECRWVAPEDIPLFHTVPGLDRSLARVRRFI